jgi:dephospho-CoA kinase
MIILGLTGSIGMGKTTAAKMLRQLGVPVHESDAAVHRLLGPRGGAVGKVAALFPDALREGPAGRYIDRKALGARVFADPAALRRLEAVLHPLVRADSERFLKRMRARREPLAVLDVPLLFETGGEARCDAVAVVSAPAVLQRQRVLRRPGMTPQRLAQVLAQQMPDAEKRRRADFVISTGQGRGVTLRALQRMVRLLRGGHRRDMKG